MAANKPLGERIRAAAENVREKTRYRDAAKRRKDNADSPEEYKRRLSILEKLRKALSDALARLKGLRKQAANRKPKPNWNGHPPLSSDSLKAVVIAANKYGLYVTATTDGTHAPGSYHYQSRAVDLAAPMTADGIARMKRFHIYAAERWPTAREVFGPGTFYIKNGIRYAGQFPAHENHNHVAI